MFSNFSSLLEILSPSQAPKEPIHNPIIEVGTELPLRSIDGQIFNCAILVPMKNSETFVRCKYILAITDLQIVELYPHSSKLGVAVAADVHELQALVKLKFKKGDQGILLLEYKNGKISKLLMDDPAVCVGHIKAKMHNMGINGSIKNKNEKIFENAQAFFHQAKEIETQFSLSPSVAHVQEMMDLLRKSAEKFGEVSDNSYMEVMDFIKKFLQRSDVSEVLDGTVGYTPLKMYRAEQGELEEKPPLKDDILSTPLAPSRIVDHKNGEGQLVEKESETTAVFTPSTCAEAPVQGASPGSSAAHTPSALTPTNASTPSALTPSGSHSYLLPDVDIELSSLRNALTYHLDEDDQHFDNYAELSDSAHPDYIHSPGPKKPVERCELSDMLDSMTQEFDSLLNSFTETGKTDTDTEDGAPHRETLHRQFSIEATTTTSVATAGEDIGDNDFDFLEVDFDETLQEIVNGGKR